MLTVRKGLRKTIAVYGHIFTALAAVGLIGFILCIIYQVVARNVLPRAPTWTEEAARYLFIYMVACGCGVSVRAGEFVGVDLILLRLPGKARNVILLAMYAGLAIFCFWYLKRSVMPFAIFNYRYISTALQMPMQYVFFALVILFPTLGLGYVFEAVDKLIEIVWGPVLPEEER